MGAGASKGGVVSAGAEEESVQLPGNSGEPSAASPASASPLAGSRAPPSPAGVGSGGEGRAGDLDAAESDFAAKKLYYAQGTAKEGPLSIGQFKAHYGEGRVTGKTLVWYQGIGRFVPLGESLNSKPQTPDPNPKAQKSSTGGAAVAWCQGIGRQACGI
jgi:hypothetical protein